MCCPDSIAFYIEKFQHQQSNWSVTTFSSEENSSLCSYKTWGQGWIFALAPAKYSWPGYAKLPPTAYENWNCWCYSSAPAANKWTTTIIYLIEIFVHLIIAVQLSLLLHNLQRPTTKLYNLYPLVQLFATAAPTAANKWTNPPDILVDLAPALQFSTPQQPGLPISVGMAQPT